MSKESGTKATTAAAGMCYDGQRRVWLAGKIGRGGVGYGRRAALSIAMKALLSEGAVGISLVWRYELLAVNQALQGLELVTRDGNL